MQDDQLSLNRVKKYLGMYSNENSLGDRMQMQDELISFLPANVLYILLVLLILALIKSRHLSSTVRLPSLRSLYCKMSVTRMSKLLDLRTFSRVRGDGVFLSLAKLEYKSLLMPLLFCSIDSNRYWIKASNNSL